MARKPTEIVPLMLRLRESLRHRLEQTAKQADRSMNAEIVDRLEKSFSRDDQKEMIAQAVRAARQSMIEEVNSRIEEQRSQLEELRLKLERQIGASKRKVKKEG
jgi:hypothetical protein